MPKKPTVPGDDVTARGRKPKRSASSKVPAETKTKPAKASAKPKGPHVARTSPESVRYIKSDAGIFGANIFRPIPKGTKERMEATTRHGAFNLFFVSPYGLSANDQDVFLTALYLASSRQPYLKLTGETEEGVKMRTLMVPKDEEAGIEAEYPFLLVKTTLGEMLRELGKDAESGANAKSLRESLERIGYVVVKATHDDGRVGNSLLMRYQKAPLSDDLGAETVHLILHSRLAAAVLGTEDGDLQHVRVNFEDRMVLESPVARIVHALVSSKVRLGGEWKIGIDKLILHVYNGIPANERTLRDRRQLVREGVAEISSLKAWKNTFWSDGQDGPVVHFKRAKTDAVFPQFSEMEQGSFKF